MNPAAPATTRATITISIVILEPMPVARYKILRRRIPVRACTRKQPCPAPPDAATAGFAHRAAMVLMTSARTLENTISHGNQRRVCASPVTDCVPPRLLAQRAVALAGVADPVDRAHRETNTSRAAKLAAIDTPIFQSTQWRTTVRCRADAARIEFSSCCSAGFSGIDGRPSSSGTSPAPRARWTARESPSCARRNGCALRHRHRHDLRLASGRAELQDLGRTTP